MTVRNLFGSPVSVDIEDGSIQQLSNGWISAFATYSHDDDYGIPNFDIYHLTTMAVPQSPDLIQTALSEVGHAFDDIVANYKDHPYWKVLRASLGAAGGGYYAGEQAWQKVHPKYVGAAIRRGAAKGAINALILPTLIFQTAKHTAHYIRKISQQGELTREKFIYVRTNEIGGVWYDDAPWTV